ncbi:hypothetical protein N7G274_010352 [Stereocaulon virgatum]|uniref:Uncharacterized protein n=1 Tax=Stereocaulon virgatum TaxID=373712 RepID=A0ABR3ZTS5_9LECA
MDRPEYSGMPEEEHVEDHYDIETRKIHGIVYGDNGRGLQQDPSVPGRDRRGRRYGTWVPEYDSKYLAIYPDIPSIPPQTFGISQERVPALNYTPDGHSPFATQEQYSSNPYSRSSAPYTPSSPLLSAPSQPFISPYASQLPAEISSSPGLPHSDDQHVYNGSWLGAEAFNPPPASSSPYDQTSPTPGSCTNQHGHQCLNYGFHRRRGNYLIRDRCGHGPLSTNTGSHSENNGASKPRKKELNGILDSGFYGGRNNKRLREDPELRHAIEASLRDTLFGNEPQASQQGDQHRSIDNVSQDDGANLASSSLKYENPKIHTPSNGIPKELTQGLESPHVLGLKGNQSGTYIQVSKGESGYNGPEAAVPKFKKTRETKAKAAAAWPLLRSARRSARKRDHEDDTDDEQTETRPDKRVRLSNQPGLQQSFSNNNLPGPSGPRRLSGHHNHARNQPHRDLDPHDARPQPRDRTYHSGHSGPPWQPTEHGELFNPQNLVQSPPLRSEWQPEEGRGTALRTIGVQPQKDKMFTPQAKSSFGDDGEDSVARETRPNDKDGEYETDGADEQREDIVKIRNTAAGSMPDSTPSSTLYQTAQQEVLDPLAYYLGYEDSSGAGTNQNFRDGPQEATSQSPVNLNHFRSRHPEIADELQKHRKRTREALEEQEGYFGDERDAGEHERKRRRASQNTEQPVRQLSSQPAHPRRRQAIRAAQEDQYQQRFAEALAQRVADVITSARFHGITYTEVPPRSEADLANIERALQPTLNAYYAYINQAAPATDRFQSYASRWRAIRHDFEQQWTATSQAPTPYLIELPALQPGMTEWQHDLEVLYNEPCHRDPPVRDEHEEEL